MKKFSKSELLLVLGTLIAIMVISFFGFREAFRRSRDGQRRSDINSLIGALSDYKEEFGFVPLSTADGRIRACEPDGFDGLVAQLKNKEITTAQYLEALRPCEWGFDGIRDLTDLTHPAYRETLPQDPKTEEGTRYVYISNGRVFQLYSALEGGATEEGYRENIVARGVECGNTFCNHGRAYLETPLDISIEEYENELESMK